MRKDPTLTMRKVQSGYQDHSVRLSDILGSELNIAVRRAPMSNLMCPERDTAYLHARIQSTRAFGLGRSRTRPVLPTWESRVARMLTCEGFRQRIVGTAEARRFASPMIPRNKWCRLSWRDGCIPCIPGTTTCGIFPTAWWSQRDTASTEDRDVAACAAVPATSSDQYSQSTCGLRATSNRRRAGGLRTRRKNRYRQQVPC